MNDERSVRSNSGESSIRRYCTGTSIAWVTRWRSHSSSAFAASNLPIRTSVPPSHSTGSTATSVVLEQSGVEARPIESGPKPKLRIRWICRSRKSWSCRMPFGAPVVPDEKIMSKPSPPSCRIAGAGPGSPSQPSSASSGTGASAQAGLAAAAAEAASIDAASAKTSFASLLASIAASVSGRWPDGIGAAQAPAATMPR